MLCVHSRSGSTNLKRPLQCLYPLEVHHRETVPGQVLEKVREKTDVGRPDSTPAYVQRPRQAAAEQARRRISEWSEELKETDLED